MEQIPIGKVSNDVFEQVVAPMKLDLIACFSLLESDIKKILASAKKNNLTEEQLIQKIEALFDGTTNQ